MLLKILTFSKALLKITADSNNSGGWLCLLLLVRQSTLRGWSSIGTPSITSLSHTHIHTHTPPGLPFIGLCLCCLFLSAVYKRQHVRKSTCPRSARTPLAAVSTAARAIGWTFQPVIAVISADWTAAPALTVLPTHVSPVSVASGLGCSTIASGCKHTQARTSARDVHSMFYARDVRKNYSYRERKNARW